jgi:hypothetical protein
MYGADGRIPAAVRILASQSDETDKKHFILFPQKRMKPALIIFHM